MRGLLVKRGFGWFRRFILQQGWQHPYVAKNFKKEIWEWKLNKWKSKNKKKIKITCMSSVA